MFKWPFLFLNQLTSSYLKEMCNQKYLLTVPKLLGYCLYVIKPYDRDLLGVGQSR